MNPAERADRIVSATAEELLSLTHRLIEIDSQIPPYGDERAIVDFLRHYLRAIGLGEGEVLAIEDTRPNLILRIPGARPGPTLMLCGHIDTKPVGDAEPQWHTDPFTPTELDGRLYGLGASDMKAAVAAMIHAARALVEADALGDGDLVLALVADEEAGANFGSRAIAGELAESVDACLIGEPSGWAHEWQGLHVVSRGLCCFRVKVRGTQMHSSLSDRMPSINANVKAAQLMVELADGIAWTYPQQQLGAVAPTLNVGVTTHGGVYFGVVPGESEFACDLRTLPGMTRESVDDDLRTWLDTVLKCDPELHASIEYDAALSWIDSATIGTDHPLVRASAQAAAEVLPAAPPLSVFPGTTDAPWFEQAGIPTLPSFGPGILTHCHGPNEFVSVESIRQAARIYARTVVHYQASHRGAAAARI